MYISMYIYMYCIYIYESGLDLETDFPNKPTQEEKNLNVN